ncbi:DUF2079 domain-containing protein [Candidatus Sumerlaeota bacterium]|nr:DUF2079 domain-containing protein [Candidatus Sumerlaeota bacterium]
MKKRRHRSTLFLTASILIFAFLIANNLIAKHNDFEDLPDLLVFETSIYNTLKGDFLYNFRGGDVCHLGIHFAPMLLVHVPFYALYQNVYALFLVQGIMTGMGALGIFFLARRILKNETASLILSIAFLINPIVLGGALWSIHEEPLSVPFLAFGFYAWAKRRWSAFWICMAGALLCKETIALMTAFLGAAFFIRYRRTPVQRRNGAVLFMISVCWFLLATKILMPLFSPLSPSDLQMAARYDARIGRAIPEMFLNLFRHPEFFLETILQSAKMKYLFNLFLPVAFLCFFSPEFLLPLVPVISMNILSYKYKWHATLLHQYTIPAAPVIFWGAMDGFRRLLVLYRIRRKKRKRRVEQGDRRRFTLIFSVIVSLGSVAGIFASGIHRWVFFNEDPRISYCPLSSTPESLSATREALALIPPDAAVSASHLLANHLAKRRILFYNKDPEIRILPFEYYVIVKTGRRGDEPEEFSDETVEFFRKNCIQVFQKDRILILKRKTPPISLEEYRRQRRRRPQME